MSFITKTDVNTFNNYCPGVFNEIVAKCKDITCCNDVCTKSKCAFCNNCDDIISQIKKPATIYSNPSIKAFNKCVADNPGIRKKYNCQSVLSDCCSKNYQDKYLLCPGYAQNYCVMSILPVENPNEPTPEPTEIPTEVPTQQPYSPTEIPYSPSQQPYFPTEVPYSPTQLPYSPTEVPYSPTEVPYSPTQQPYSPTEVPYFPTQLPYSPTQQPYFPTEVPYSPTQRPYSPTQRPYSPTEVPTQTPYTQTEAPKQVPNQPPIDVPNQSPIQGKYSHSQNIPDILPIIILFFGVVLILIFLLYKNVSNKKNISRSRK